MQISATAARRIRIAAIGIGAVSLAMIVIALLLLSFGWTLLRPVIERRATAALHRPVTIGRIRRIDGLSLYPLLSFEEVRIAQPAWVGGGSMVQLKAARVRIALLPLLTGRVRMQVMLLDGIRVALVRGKDGKGNWERQGPQRSSGGSTADLGSVVIRDGIVSIDDRRLDRHFVTRVTVDARGFDLAGPGSIGGTAATLMVKGAPVAGGGAWPFTAEVRSAAVNATMRGRMRTPLDIGHFDAEVSASGRDLRDLDRLIEAGLPATQPFRLTAFVRHDQPAWFVTRLAGRIGRSDVTGAISVRKDGERTLIDGGLASPAFDFDDLATDAQLAQAVALEKRLGPRVFPTTPLDLSKMRMTDGTLKISIARILSRKPTVFRSVRGALTLDHGVLKAAPLAATMAAGTLTGTIVVRHQSGTPLLSVDLRLKDSRLERIFRTNGILAGPLAGRAVLNGRGDTVRTAIGHADGRIGIVSRDGEITRRVALFLGADIGHGLFAGKIEKTRLTCLIAGFRVMSGSARPAALVIDTPEARADGSGMVNLANEQVRIALKGMPKRGSLLRLNGPIEAGGTLMLPTVNPPPQTKTAGGLLKMVGKALGGHVEPLGVDANCAGLAARALR